jgi:hypothetical protein
MDRPVGFAVGISLRRPIRASLELDGMHGFGDLAPATTLLLEPT